MQQPQPSPDQPDNTATNRITIPILLILYLLVGSTLWSTITEYDHLARQEAIGMVVTDALTALIYQTLGKNGVVIVLGALTLLFTVMAVWGTVTFIKQRRQIKA
ncbi:MAG: hypothetical protein U0528_07600 [Anaerolineae bacterium]